MAFIWDYNRNELRKSKRGKALLLERTINYGPDEGEKIDLKQVKKSWKSLNLFPARRRLLELLIWGRPRSSQKSKS